MLVNPLLHAYLAGSIAIFGLAGDFVAGFGAAASRAKNKWRQDIKRQDMLQCRL